MQPLFQSLTHEGVPVTTDSGVRKPLASINLAMNLPMNFYTFHAFRCSGATLAYKAHVPTKEIMEIGNWTPDCVWRYIQKDQDRGSTVAIAMQDMLL